MQESKIAKLQKDLTFYINKANTLEHNLRKEQLQSSPNYGHSHEDTKMSRSVKVRAHETSPFRAGPSDQLQPVVR